MLYCFIGQGFIPSIFKEEKQAQLIAKGAM